MNVCDTLAPRGNLLMKQPNLPTDWDTVFEKELDRIYHYCIYRVGDTTVAQDLTAETFEVAWANRHKYKPSKALPSTWLLGIARKRVGMYARKNQRNKQVSLSFDMKDGVASLGELLDEKQEKEQLFSLITTLSAKDQELFALKYGAGLNNRQIAKIVKMTESNVGTRLHKSMKYLRREVEKKSYGNSI